LGRPIFQIAPMAKAYQSLALAIAQYRQSIVDLKRLLRLAALQPSQRLSLFPKLHVGRQIGKVRTLLVFAAVFLDLLPEFAKLEDRSLLGRGSHPERIQLMIPVVLTLKVDGAFFLSVLAQQDRPAPRRRSEAD